MGPYTIYAKAVFSAVILLATLILWGRVDLKHVLPFVFLVVSVSCLRIILHWSACTPTNRTTRLDLITEIFSALIVLPGATLLCLMLTTNIVDFSGIAGWPLAAAMIAAIVIHFCINLIPGTLQHLRIYARLSLVLAILIASFGAAKERHPYLLESGATKRRMIAEKVWNLGLSIEASRHTDKLFAYAEDLITENRLEDAVTVYQRGLTIDPHNRAAHAHLSKVFDRLGRQTEANHHRQIASQALRLAGVLQTSQDPIPPLEFLPERAATNFRICLVPIGEVPDGLLDRVGAELIKRGKVPVFRSRETLALPAPDRINGVIGLPQWNAENLWRIFTISSAFSYQGPVQYLLVSSGDLYTENSNFVFGVSFLLHGEASFARFRSYPDGDLAKDDLLVDRLAKQLLSCSIKSFRIPASTTLDCVTTFCRNLEEFDQKSSIAAPWIDQRYREMIRKYETGQFP